MKRIVPAILVFVALGILVWWLQRGGETTPRSAGHDVSPPGQAQQPAARSRQQVRSEALPHARELTPVAPSTSPPRWADRSQLSGMGARTFDEFHAWMDRANLTEAQRGELLPHLADAVESLRRVRKDVVERSVAHEPHPEVIPGETYAEYIGDELRNEIAGIVNPAQLEAFDEVFPLPVVLAAAAIAEHGE